MPFGLAPLARQQLQILIARLNFIISSPSSIFFLSSSSSFYFFCCDFSHETFKS